MEVLAAHPEIALGVERYKGLWGGAAIAGLVPELFDRDRFFDFSDGLTNLTPGAFDGRWDEHYRRMAEKWDTASYVGDKMTRLRLQALWKLHPQARFVCIVRNIDEVAHSWNERAHNPDDRGWPTHADAQVAVRRWNAALARIRRAARQRPDRVVVVEYARFFGDPEASALLRTLDALELEAEAGVRARFAEAHRTYVTHIAGKDRGLSATDRAFIDQHADREVWRDVSGLAV
jgi:hypothetical protein